MSSSRCELWADPDTRVSASNYTGFHSFKGGHWSPAKRALTLTCFFRFVSSVCVSVGKGADVGHGPSRSFLAGSRSVMFCDSLLFTQTFRTLFLSRPSMHACRARAREACSPLIRRMFDMKSFHMAWALKVQQRTAKRYESLLPSLCVFLKGELQETEFHLSSV